MAMCILDLLLATAVPTGVTGYQMHLGVILMAVTNVLASTPATRNPLIKADARRVANGFHGLVGGIPLIAINVSSP